jgi:hypothetical protein
MNIELINQNEGLCSFLKDSINSYIERKDSNSIRGLSLKSALHRKTISKLKDGQASLSIIDPIKLMKLVETVNFEKLDMFKASFKNVFNEMINEKYSEFLGAHDSESLQESNAVESISNESDYLVYLRASSRGGSSISEITFDLGHDAVASIDKLLALKLIMINETTGKLVNNSNKTQYWSRETLVRYMPVLQKFYKLGNAGKELNYIFSISQNLNKNGIAAIRNAYKKFVSETNTIINNEKYQGDTPYYYAGSMDTLKRDSVEQSEVIQ